MGRCVPLEFRDNAQTPLDFLSTKRLQNFQGMLTRSPEGARAALAAMLAGPMKFEPVQTPNGPRFRVTAKAIVSRLVEPASGSFVCVPNGMCT
jgi:hypothetical protein